MRNSLSPMLPTRSRLPHFSMRSLIRTCCDLCPCSPAMNSNNSNECRCGRGTSQCATSKLCKRTWSLQPEILCPCSRADTPMSWTSAINPQVSMETKSMSWGILRSVPECSRPTADFQTQHPLPLADCDAMGRYGDPLDPVGDIWDVQRISCFVKPGGLLYLGVPMGPDQVLSHPSTPSYPISHPHPRTKSVPLLALIF